FRPFGKFVFQLICSLLRGGCALHRFFLLAQSAHLLVGLIVRLIRSADRVVGVGATRQRLSVHWLGRVVRAVVHLPVVYRVRRGGSAVRRIGRRQIGTG